MSYRSNLPRQRAIHALLSGVGTLTALVLFFAVSTVQAQQTPYYDLSTPEVTVDLSVLNDGGIGRPSIGAVSPSVGGGQLIVPGGKKPVSRLLVAPPKKRATIKRPRTKAKKRVVKKSAPKVRKPKPQEKKKPERIQSPFL